MEEEQPRITRITRIKEKQEEQEPRRLLILPQEGCFLSVLSVVEVRRNKNENAGALGEAPAH
jgi:hypothetical protein